MSGASEQQSGMLPADAPADQPAESHDPPWPLRKTPSRLSAVLWAAGLALVCALVETFLVPLHIAGIPVPLSVVGAVVITPLLVRWTYRATGSALLAGVPAVVWVLVVLPLSTERPEGDIVIPGTVTGTAFLVLGLLAAVLSWVAVWAGQMGKATWPAP